MQARLLRQTCGDIPLAVYEDASPSFLDVVSVASEEGLVPFVSPRCFGHVGGALASMRQAIRWGRMLGLDRVAHVAARHFVTSEDWIRREGDAACWIARGDDPFYKFLRTEVIVFRVSAWTDRLLDFFDPKPLGIPLEAWFYLFLHTQGLRSEDLPVSVVRYSEPEKVKSLADSLGCEVNFYLGYRRALPDYQP